jgi:hypothetical protein
MTFVNFYRYYILAVAQALESQTALFAIIGGP